jgi:hypothetical protein
MNSKQWKDPAVHKLLGRIRRDLGDNAFDIVDHWKDDHLAIGLALPSDHRVLAYISTFTNVDDNHLYSYYLELPPTSAHVEYSDAGGSEDCTYDELLAALCSHWNIER